MTAIIGAVILTAMFGSVAWASIEKNTFKRIQNPDRKSLIIWIILVLGFIVRIIAAASYRGHETDMNCFSGWSDMIFNNGISQFYLSDGFHDYPPGYVYIMWVLGALKSVFNSDGPALWVLLKLPSIIADLGMGYLAYKIATKSFSQKAGVIISAFIVFNPAIIFNSCLWGQVDSVLAIFCALSVYFMAEKKFAPSFFAFGAAVLIKPQAIFFAPVLAFGVIEEIFINNEFDAKKLIKTVLWALAAVASVFILFMPFGTNPIHGIEVILNQYIATVGQYNYMTINAFNLYGALGQNWTALTAASSVIGYILMAAVVVLAGIIFFKKDGKEKYYLVSAVLVFGIYMLAPKMHERYAFPGMFMLIMLVATLPTWKNFICYGLFSLSQFFNIAWVLLVYETEPGAYFKSSVIVVASVINIIVFAWMAYYAFKPSEIIEHKSVQQKTKQPQKHPMQKAKATKQKQAGVFRLSEKLVKITAVDIAIMIGITLVYGCVAFYKLGDKYAPQTNAAIAGENLTVDFGEEKEISKTAFFLGARNLETGRNLTFTYFDGNNQVVKEDVIDSGAVFCWTIREGIDTKARYAVISSNCTENPYDPSDKLYLNEVCFLGTDGGVITPANAKADDVDALFDEQEYLTTEKSYMSGSYFDEIYHPRTAYEFLHGMSVYEWTHPPLGKVLMGIGISIFGMVPFGWRFIGTLFGVLMVPVVYLLARRCLRYRWIAILGCLIFTFDFMHFTQTRLATIDTYVTFFIMLMYYYMYKYYKKSFYDTPLFKTLIPLGLSGIFFGLSVASKWTGLYAGAGLAIIFFITISDRYKEYKFALSDPKGETDGISHKTVIDKFTKNTVITLAFCCVMFIVVPFAIYTLSYIPYMNTPSGEGFKTIFTNAESMLTYHGKTVVASTHPYSSHWYEWPIMYRPLWYFSNTLDNGMKQGISAMGNPAVWWLGIPAVAYCVAVSLMVPLREKNYFGKNKYYFVVAYAVILELLCVFAYFGSDSGSERLLPCVMVYAAIMILAFLFVVMADEKHSQKSIRTPLFLVIGYFSGYMPWMLVLRTTYIYHYFPCVVFVVLMIGYCFKSLYDNSKNKKAVIAVGIGYAVITVGLFVLFYPVISGAPVSLDFAEKWLKWFSSWVLVA